MLSRQNNSEGQQWDQVGSAASLQEAIQEKDLKL